MILYHGSNQDIGQVDVMSGYIHKDFGKGFYLTPNKEVAISIAVKKVLIKGGTPTLIEYDFDDRHLFSSSLKVKKFDKADLEWLEFIDKNRFLRTTEPIHDYDIVIGPIADDDVIMQFTLYHKGLQTYAQAISKLLNGYKDIQYCFCTQKAADTLIKINSTRL